METPTAKQALLNTRMDTAAIRAIIPTIRLPPMAGPAAMDSEPATVVKVGTVLILVTVVTAGMPVNSVVMAVTVGMEGAGQSVATVGTAVMRHMVTAAMADMAGTAQRQLAAAAKVAKAEMQALIRDTRAAEVGVGGPAGSTAAGAVAAAMVAKAIVVGMPVMEATARCRACPESEARATG